MISDVMKAMSDPKDVTGQLCIKTTGNVQGKQFISREKRK